jgi:organic radical activating enzyme
MKLSSFFHFAAFGVKTILLRKKSPILGTVILTDKCNLHCKHCSVNNITAIVHPYEQIWQEMQRLYDMGVRILFFCGGETFLWKDGERTLRDLVIEAKNMGFLIVNVVTNGTFPIDLPEADLILLSLDGDKQRDTARSARLARWQRHRFCVLALRRVLSALALHAHFQRTAAALHALGKQCPHRSGDISAPCGVQPPHGKRLHRLLRQHHYQRGLRHAAP